MPKYEVEFAMRVHGKAVIEAEDADAAWAAGRDLERSCTALSSHQLVFGGSALHIQGADAITKHYLDEVEMVRLVPAAAK